MKISVTFVIAFLRLTNSLNLNLSADNINCVLYRTYTNYRIITAAKSEKILEQDIFNPSLKTVFLITGTNTAEDSSKIRPILEAYANSKRYNVIHFDHSYYTLDNNVEGIYGEILHWLGELFGSIISNLIKLGVPSNSIELVAHSYGASVAIITANNTFPTLPLLIGLDPSVWVPFRKGYADYTIVLHTNMGISSSQFYNKSNSDLIANDGSIQPACIDHNVFNETGSYFEQIRKCSHLMALNYWSSLIENPGLFYGVECNATDCNYNIIQQLGPNLRTPGVFKFKTSIDYPYGLNLEGVKNITPVDIERLNAYSLSAWYFTSMRKKYVKGISDQLKYRIKKL